MKNITTRQYQILADHMRIYQFMIDIYEKDWRNGVPAPFLEYALSSEWMDKSYTHRNRIWEDNGQIVAFCFTESPVTDIYFSLRPGYEELAPEMIAYADAHMPRIDGHLRFVLFQGQAALMDAARKVGYTQTGSYTDMIYEFDKPLDFPLPEGYHFVAPGKCIIEKIQECCWKGFNHEAEEGPWHGNAREAIIFARRRMPPCSILWQLKMRPGSMYAMPECGGLRKTIWLTWNRFVPFPSTAVKAWLLPLYPNCTAGWSRWAPRI